MKFPETKWGKHCTTLSFTVFFSNVIGFALFLPNQQEKVTCKRLPIDARIELVTPSEAARFTGAPRDASGNKAPIPGPKLIHQFAKNHVFFRRPWSLYPFLVHYSFHTHKTLIPPPLQTFSEKNRAFFV